MEDRAGVEAQDSLTSLDIAGVIDHTPFDTLEPSSDHSKILSLLRLPLTPARKTFEVFGGGFNLDPVKYSPPNPEPQPRMSTSSRR